MRKSAKTIRGSVQDCGFACLVGVAYFLAACLSLHLTQGVGGIATIWPASGVLVSALLLSKPGQLVPLICAISFASIASNMAYGAPGPVALGFTIANIVEGVLISQLVIRTSGVPRTLNDTRWLATFLGATVVGSAASGAIAALLTGNIALPFFVSWFMTVCLGTLVVTPLIVTIASEFGKRHQGFSDRNVGILLLPVVCVATICPLVLSYQDERLLFLPVIGVILATYLFGSRGAAANISLIAVVATIQTDFSGSEIGASGLNGDTLFLQFYLLSLICAVWPLSVLMAEKEHLIGRYAETNSYLTMAESTAHVGHWHIGSDNTSLFWSEEVYRIHDLDPIDLNFDDTMDLEEPTSLQLYHPEDRGTVRAVLLAAMERREAFSYEARIVRPDGSIRHVSSLGQPRYGASGEFEGLFGTFQDITEQVDTLEALRNARNEALHKAIAAQRLAETDDLTGIANRRKIFADLRAAARSAKRLQEPLSIAILDIDYFKSVNDRHGHQTGDDVLKRVVQLVSSQLRSTDFMGRLGGEEFLVILPGKNESDSYNAIEHVRRTIASETWSKTGLAKITVSAGLATLSESYDIDDTLQRADGALYTAKEAGRNLLRSAA